MLLYLFTKGTKIHFAELTVPRSYIVGDVKTFLAKTAKEYAQIRKESVVVKTKGFEDMSAEC